MGTIEKKFLSGSTDGKPIPIGNAGDTTRSTIHTATDDGIDEVWIWATNTAGSAIDLSIEFGEQGVDHEFRQSITNGNGLNLICQGVPISGTGSVVTAFAASTSGINLLGFINRIDQQA